MLDFLLQFNQFSSSKLFSLTAAAAVVVGQPTNQPAGQPIINSTIFFNS